MNSTPEQIVADVIKNELGLTDEQVWVRNQNRKIPNDDQLYVVCGQVDSEMLGVTRNDISTDDGMDEIQQVQARENIQIDLFSSSNEAMTRRLEVLAALISIYSEQAQELNQFKIFSVPRSFLNTSDAEGGSRLNRFSILISCFVWYRKQKAITVNDRKYYNGDYYDQFPAKGYDEPALENDEPIFEFNLTE